MNKTCSIIILTLATQLPLPHIAAADSGAADLLGIFDGSAETISAQALIRSYEAPLPARSEPLRSQGVRRKFLYEILAEQEELGDKKFYTPQEIAAMIKEDYGDDPSEKEKKQIRKALEILQTTKFGTEMCKAVAYECTIESLEKAGIRLRVKEISFGQNQTANGVVPPPLDYAGRTFIGLGKNIVSKGYSEDLALTLLHEMSHVQDLRKNKTGTLMKALYATEEKALINELSAYDEISRKSGFRNDLFSFLIEVWAWKNESGPYPKHRSLTLPLGPKGEVKTVTTADMLNNYMPGISFLSSLERLVYLLWHSAYKDPKVKDELVRAIKTAAWERSEAYKAWRKNPVVPAPPAVTPPPTTVTPPANPPKPPKPPKPPQDDDDGGYQGGGGGSGGNFNPGPYNPHFGDGI